MNKEPLQPFVPDERWREHNGVLLVIAHPDDEVLMGWGVIQTFADAGIPVTVLLATLGEHGKIEGQTRSQDETAAVRTREFAQSAKALGVRGAILSPVFSDGSLKNRQEELNNAVSDFVRTGKYDVIVSFAPAERTYRFDHRDHHAVSEAAILASETADMQTDGTIAAPLPYRPALLGWTTNPDAAPKHQMHQVAIPEDLRVQRMDFLAKYYGSQFSEQTRKQWEPVFDRITRDDATGTHRQLLFRIR